VDNYDTLVIAMKDEQLWKAALGQLELQVSQGNFLTWFRQTKIKERVTDGVVIETDSPFAYEWLSRKYHQVILSTLQALDTSVKKVQFSISSQSNQKKALRKNFHIVAQKQPRAEHTQVFPQTIPTDIPIKVMPIGPTTKVFNSKYTFESYIVGPSNEIAHAACRAVATKPGEIYNPLFIYGGVGLGKTHLLQAVGNAVLANNPHFKVLYVSSEKFMNEFVQAVGAGKIQEFKKNYRNTDIFIMDDVQLLAGKNKTQEELFHTFNALQSQNKQVILSSDRPPSAIPTLEERLSSRLSGGMIADIKKPDYETRLAILEAKAHMRGVDIDAESLAFIAKNIQKNVRELEGALNRVIAYCELHNKQGTLEYTTKVLEGIMDQSQHKTISVKQIIDSVSSYYDVQSDDLCGKCRKKEIVRPRQVAMYLLRKENNMSFPSIGEYFGGRDHTTAMHACEKIEKLLEHDEDLVQEVNFLKERLYA
jgi:chromosomal replication initiator protein